jgi:eukaryotic-like serine/threonine-protein kinase
VTEPTDRLGRYTLVTELAPGAFGPLWAARVASGAEEGRLVVVRRIAVPGGDTGLVQRLSEAAFAAMEVRNAKIAAVLDVVVAEREVAVVSEYVDAQALRSLMRLAALKREPIPPAVALRIAMDVLQALRAAREAWSGQALEDGFHGGLTPDSVLLATFGDVMLADLGVSAVIVASEALKDDPSVVAYRAPEQLAATAPADERADVFTIGVLLWELIVSRPLFGFPGRLRERDGPRVGGAGAAEDVRTKPIPALDAVERVGAPVPRQVVDVVKRALERDPKDRFQSVEQMLGHILAQARGIAATPEQVAMILDRLARSEIDARRASIASLGGVDSDRPISDRPSGEPPSGRPTRRPPPPDARPKVVVDFSKHEAPTTPALTKQGTPPTSIADKKRPVVSKPASIAEPKTPRASKPPSPIATRKAPVVPKSAASLADEKAPVVTPPAASIPEQRPPPVPKRSVPPPPPKRAPKPPVPNAAAIEPTAAPAPPFGALPPPPFGSVPPPPFVTPSVPPIATPSVPRAGFETSAPAVSPTGPPPSVAVAASQPADSSFHFPPPPGSGNDDASRVAGAGAPVPMPALVDDFRPATSSRPLSERRLRARKIAVVAFATVGVLLLAATVRALFSGSEPEDASPPTAKSQAASKPAPPPEPRQTAPPSEPARSAPTPVAPEASVAPAPTVTTEPPSAPETPSAPLNEQRPRERPKKGFRPRGI